MIGTPTPYVRLVFGSSKAKTTPIKSNEPDFDQAFVLVHKEGAKVIAHGSNISLGNNLSGF